MTINHPIRRRLAGFCSPATMTRIVDPILADIRWERRPRWLGYLALARALTTHVILATPSAVSRTWTEDDRAIPRVALFAVITATVGAFFMGLPPVWKANRYGPLWIPAILLAPQALVLTLPAALLLAIPVALRRHEPSGRLARRTVALAIGCVAVTFVMLVWIVPETNQAFRVLTSGQHDLPRGPREQGFAAMREQIEVVKLTYGGHLAARRLEYDYHVRLMIICLPLPLGVLALGISRSRRGRRRPWAMGLAAMGGYVFVFFPALVGARTLMRWSSLPPALFAWIPILLLAIVAFRVYSSASVLPDPSAAS